MKNDTKQWMGWSSIILGALIALNEYFAWGSGWQYLWATLVLVLGIWILSTK